MKKSKEELAEEYLKSCIVGQGANEMVSYAEALYAIQLTIEDLQDKDAVEFLEEQSYFDSFDKNTENDRCFVYIDDAKQALSIQSANFEKKAVDIICKICENQASLSFFPNLFKQHLNSK